MRIFLLGIPFDPARAGITANIFIFQASSVLNCIAKVQTLCFEFITIILRYCFETELSHLHMQHNSLVINQFHNNTGSKEQNGINIATIYLGKVTEIFCFSIVFCIFFNKKIHNSQKKRGKYKILTPSLLYHDHTYLLSLLSGRLSVIVLTILSLQNLEAINSDAFCLTSSA